MKKISVSMPDCGEAGVIVINAGRGRGLVTVSGNAYSTWTQDGGGLFQMLHDELTRETVHELHAGMTISVLTGELDFSILERALYRQSVVRSVRTRRRRVPSS